MTKATFLVAAMGLTVPLGGGCQDKHPPGHEHAAGGDARAEPARTVPPEVAAALQRQSPGATITKFHTHPNADGTLRWHLHYTTPAGKEDEASFEASGKLIE